MTTRKPYSRKLHVLSASILKAIGLVAAGGLTMVIVLTIAKGVSVKSDSSPGGKVIGFRHEAANMRSNGDDGSPPVSTTVTDGGEERPADTVMRNGVTVVSPELLIPSVDIAALQNATGADDATSSEKISTAKKRSKQPRNARGNSRWKAYGLAIR